MGAEIFQIFAILDTLESYTKSLTQKCLKNLAGELLKCKPITCGKHMHLLLILCLLPKERSFKKLHISTARCARSMSESSRKKATGFEMSRFSSVIARPSFDSLFYISCNI